MELSEYSALDAVGLRALIRNGEVPVNEVDALARRAVAAVDPDLNAIAGELVQSQAFNADGPLGGVPFVVKDSGPFARGIPFALGSRAIKGAVADSDHPLMAMFREAGLSTIGQSAAPELSLSFATESRLRGVTRNPWALDRGVGGSSGGAAALVAAGCVPIAHASDGAGSIRVPASSCGLVGLKPSRGRTPTTQAVAEGALPTAVDFVLTRTVRDSALVLRAVGTPPDRPLPPLPRIGVLTDSAAPVDPQVLAATLAATSMLEWIGYPVAEVRSRVAFDDVVAGSMLAIVAAARAMLAAPRPVDHSLLEAVSRSVLREAATDTAPFVSAQQRVTAGVDEMFSGVDVLVTPTLAQLPGHHGEIDYDTAGFSAERWLRRLFEHGPFTAIYNVSGHPAISVPVGQSRDGLPIGVQLVAAHGADELLLHLAAELETALPWSGRRPPIYADR